MDRGLGIRGGERPHNVALILSLLTLTVPKSREIKIVRSILLLFHFVAYPRHRHSFPVYLPVFVLKCATTAFRRSLIFTVLPAATRELLPRFVERSSLIFSLFGHPPHPHTLIHSYISTCHSQPGENKRKLQASFSDQKKRPGHSTNPVFRRNPILSYFYYLAASVSFRKDLLSLSCYSSSQSPQFTCNASKPNYRTSTFVILLHF